MTETSPDQNRASRKDTDLGRLFSRPAFLSLTIGIPFCIFKVLFGISAMQTAQNPYFFGVGAVIVLWAVTDLLMNAGRLVLDIAHKPARFEYCSIAQIGRFLKMPSVFLAIDTLITFAIICAMLWSGWITRLGFSGSILWYAATTLNLISLSVVSLYNEVKNIRPEQVD